MNGTKRAATLPMRLMPPRITAPTQSAIAAPNSPWPSAVTFLSAPTNHSFGFKNISTTNAVSWLDENNGRQPNTPKKQNAIASGFHFAPSPSTMKYIGPPCTWPWASRPRYITARLHVKNLVAMPTSAQTHIQNSAPGPPVVTATATPPILPMPTVPERALHNA